MNKYAGKRPGFGEKIAFALGDGGCNFVWTTLGSFLTVYYTDNVGIAAATIGIVPLAGMAKVLEFAARDSDIGRIESLHGTFIEEWTTYEEKLKGVFGIVADEVAALSGDEDMLRGMLQILKNAFEDFDVDAADDIIKKIKSYSYSDKINAYVKDLLGAVADLDEDTANEIMKSIEEELG